MCKLLKCNDRHFEIQTCTMWQLYPETSLHPRDPLAKAQGRLLVERFTKMIPKYYGVSRER